jgi:tetratricopeptide (TPR) repeat protein
MGPLLLATTILLAAPATEAADDGHATVLVLPFLLKGEATPWTGVALAESLVDFVVQVNEDNFLTLKQLDAVLRPRKLALTDAQAIHDKATELARTLGASDVIVGEVHRKGDIYTIDARRLRLGVGKPLKVGHVQGSHNVMPVLTKKLAQELLGTSTKSPPMSTSQAAIEEAAQCTGMVARQSLSPKAKGTIEEPLLAEAEKHCNLALDKDPQIGLAKAGLAVIQACRGDYEESMKTAQLARAKRFIPLSVLAEYFARQRAGDDVGARTVLDDSVAAHPGFLHALGYLGEDRLERHDDGDAKTEFERYLKRVPGHPWATAMLAHALARLGHKDEALKLTEAALQQNPRDPELSIELGSRLIDLGRDAEAEPHLRTAMEATPPRALAGLRLGFLYLRAKRLKEARETLTQVVMLATRTDESVVRALAQVDLARVSALENHVDEAVQHLSAARDDGLRKLPCDEAVFEQFKTNPDFIEACKEPQDSPGTRTFRESEASSAVY